MPTLHRFRPRLLDHLARYTRADLAHDVGAGITVGIVALPLAMAFAIASGAKPEQGIFTAIVAGLLIAALGGSSVQIGGPAGAFIVIVYGIVQHHGYANLLVATALAGVLLFALGWLRLGVLVRYIPVSIVIGFTNGIAVLIALSQVKDLLGLATGPLPADFFGQIGALASHLDSFNPSAFALGAACLLGLFAWSWLVGRRAALPPALAEGRTLRFTARLPGPIVALVSLTLLAQWLALPVETIGSRFGGIPRALPVPEWPALSWAGVQQLLVPTITIALLGAIESLLCARIADNLVELPRHDPNQELMAQGVANMVVPLVGGLPATGTIARTVTNIRAGARSPVAGIVHALTLLAIVLAAAPLAADVPLAVLAGILLHVAWNMGEWHEFSRLRRFSLEYRAKLLGTFALTVMVDLTVAVEVGLVLACVFFIYRMGALFRVEPVAAPPGVQALRLSGTLFFGAVGKVEAVEGLLAPDTRTLVLDGTRLLSLDTTGLDALRQLQRTLARRDVRLVLCGLDDEARALIRRAGFEDLLGAVGIAPDLDSALAAATARAAA